MENEMYRERIAYLASLMISMFCLASPVAVLAAPIVDQSFLWNTTGVVDSYSFGYGYPLDQTFPVGVNGNLTGVDLVIQGGSFPDTAVTVAIRSTSDGVPLSGSANILSSVSVLYSSFPVSTDPDSYITLTHFTFPSGGVPVDTGELLAVDISCNNAILMASGYSSYAGGPSGYSGGAAFLNYEPLNSTPTSIYFQTYVSAPEPTSVGLLGLCAMGILMRKRSVRK
jgi:hypothetical protein